MCVCVYDQGMLAFHSAVKEIRFSFREGDSPEPVRKTFNPWTAQLGAKTGAWLTLYCFGEKGQVNECAFGITVAPPTGERQKRWEVLSLKKWFK